MFRFRKPRQVALNAFSRFRHRAIRTLFSRAIQWYNVLRKSRGTSFPAEFSRIQTYYLTCYCILWPAAEAVSFGPLMSNGTNLRDSFIFYMWRWPVYKTTYFRWLPQLLRWALTRVNFNLILFALERTNFCSSSTCNGKAKDYSQGHLDALHRAWNTILFL